MGPIIRLRAKNSKETFNWLIQYIWANKSSKTFNKEWIKL
jgi:hypothetical protein